MRLAGIHALAGPVRDRDGAEGRFDILREPERDFVRRGPHRVADPWVGPVEHGVSLRGGGASSVSMATTMNDWRMSVAEHRPP